MCFYAYLYVFTGMLLDEVQHIDLNPIPLCSGMYIWTGSVQKQCDLCVRVFSGSVRHTFTAQMNVLCAPTYNLHSQR